MFCCIILLGCINGIAAYYKKKTSLLASRCIHIQIFRTGHAKIINFKSDFLLSDTMDEWIFFVSFLANEKNLFLE